MSLLFGVLQQKRFRLEVIHLLVIFRLVMQINHTPGLQVFETHVRITQLLLALLNRAAQVALRVEFSLDVRLFLFGHLS